MQLPPYIPAWTDLRPFVADVVLIATAVAVLIVPFFTRKANSATGVVTLAGLVAALVAVGPADGGSVGGGRFAPMLAADGVAFAWKCILLLFVIGVVVLWFASSRADLPAGDGADAGAEDGRSDRPDDGPEFFLLLICATLGMSLMGSAANLLMLFIAVELASLPSYVLAGFRKNNRTSAEAALKYVLFGAAASGVMVWGLSLLYGVCGTLNLYSSADHGTHVAGVAEQVFRQSHASPLLLIGLLALVVGLAFKISAVPFHLWCPDVFEGAAVEVTTFLSVASKGAGLVLLLRVAVALGEAAGFAPTTPNVMLAWVLGLMGVLTCTVGNTAAYVQTNLKRLLAYSSIAHAGYMLCVVAMVVVAPRSMGVAGGTAASAALLFYLAVYLFMNLGAFTVVAIVGRQSGETLEHFSGLGRRSPVLAMCMTLCCFSLIGLPPLAGFTAKFNLMATLGSAGGWWWGLVAAIAVNTLLSLYYYVRVIRTMYLEDAGKPRLTRSPLGTGLAMASAAMLLALFVGSNVLTRWTSGHAVLRPSVSAPMPMPVPGAVAVVESP
ncbi:NADH-quinone oxidoreductase subunit N [Humisphaera borealis]|uniref:NADH-quinone oxidoreductase subunit N n=2 Tax=Humisphaera borealis TaxID=2807512 RepID=A0A7M2WXR7_9BACT|nr:NADH-quinone oxidoreductase subunit N [Humisphaera borealis]